MARLPGMKMTVLIVLSYRCCFLDSGAGPMTPSVLDCHAGVGVDEADTWIDKRWLTWHL